MDLNETTRGGVDKISRYGWTLRDSPGEMRLVNKKDLRVDREHYQRHSSDQKVTKLSQEWSWVACGVLIVASRNGELWVIDGQHRLYGAMRRSDITTLPCIVFQSAGAEQEASGFLMSNSSRKPVTAVQKQRALVTCKDEVACFVQDVIDRMELQITEVAHCKGQIKCVAWCVKRAAEDRTAFVKAMELCNKLCRSDEIPVPEKLLEAMWLLHRGLECGIDDGRFHLRAFEIGAKSLLRGINRAQAIYEKGGGKIWAAGVLDEINKGLRKKFALRNHEERHGGDRD